MQNSIQHLAGTTLLTLVLLAGCAATPPEVASDADRSVNFSSYHSFALVPRDRVVMSMPPDAMHNPLLISRIEDEVKQGMQRKGYTLTDPMNADFVVDFTIGARERLDIRSSPGGFGFGPGGSWGNDINVRQVREGSLAIDVFDAHTRHPVWHGWTQKELTRKDIEQSSVPIHDAVESVLAKFPSGS